MNNNDTEIFALHVKGIDLPVQRVRGNETDGIGICHIGGEVVIAINHQGYAYYVSLGGEDIDLVAHRMANAMSKATRAAPPTMESRQ